MSTKKNKPPLVLDMDFNKALRRYAQTDIDELPDNIRLKKKGGTKPPPKVSKSS